MSGEWHSCARQKRKLVKLQQTRLRGRELGQMARGQRQKNSKPTKAQAAAAESPNITHSESKEKKPPSQESAVHDVLEQLDLRVDKHNDKHDYERLNLQNNTENSRTKASGKKKLGIALEATQVYEQCYQKLQSETQNESRVESGAKGSNSDSKTESGAKGNNSGKQYNSLRSQSSLELSENELASASLLTSLPEGQIDKDIAVAVSGTASFTYKELSQATDGFSEGNKIGSGAFGDVYLAVLKNSKCAVKRLKKPQQSEAGNDGHTTRNAAEIKSLMRFRHENIVQLYGIAVDQDEICLVYQYMDNGSLLDRLQCRGDSAPLSWEQRINILRGGACGIQYLHTMDSSRPLIHGDIKSSNILLDRHFEAKVSDLGLAEYANAGQVTGMLTHVSRKDLDRQTYASRAYMPSDYFSSGPSVKSDTYGFGVIMLEVCSGEEAYDERREGEHFLAQYVRELLEEQPEGAWPEHLIDRRAGPCPDQLQHVIKLALKCVSERKRSRPAMTETLKQLEWILDHWKNSSSHKVYSPSSEGIACSSHMTTGNQSFDPSQGKQSDIDQLAWSSSQRKTSLPCQRVTAKPIPILTKSQSLDAQPESLRLQQMYDQMQYQNKVRLLAPVLAEQSVDSTPSASGQTSPSQLYLSDPVKLAKLQEYGYLQDSSLDSVTMTMTTTLTEENVSHLTDIEYGSDQAKLKAMADFDNQSKDSPAGDAQAYEEYARKKLEEIELFDKNNMNPPPQSDSAQPSHSGEDSEGSVNVERTTESQAAQATLLCQENTEGESPATQGNPGLEMATFFSNYEAETANIGYDDSGQIQGQIVEGQIQGQIAEGQTDQSQGDTTENSGFIYCGIGMYEGQEMAILLDPVTQREYAVDPSTLDPLIYHQQQLQYYTQCQTDIGSEDTRVASTGS